MAGILFERTHDATLRQPGVDPLEAVSTVAATEDVVLEIVAAVVVQRNVDGSAIVSRQDDVDDIGSGGSTR